MKKRRIWAILLVLALLVTTCPTGATVTRAETATDAPAGAYTVETIAVTRHGLLDYQYITTGGLKSNCVNTHYAAVGTTTPPAMCLEKNPDGTYTRVEYKNPYLYVEYYDENFLLIPERSHIKKVKGTLYGGAYFGEQYNYVLVGSPKGSEAALDGGIWALHRYDKEWNLLGIHSRSDNMFSRPFSLGSCDFAEIDGELVIHTCFTMIGDVWDGGSHQGCVTFRFDQETFDLALDSFFDATHSMNQFVAVDEESYYLIDHGDGPRSMQLWRCNPDDPEDFTYTQFMRFYGEGGNVETHALLGGMEIIGDRVVTAVASIDHEYFFAGGTRTDDQMNIGVFSHSKDLSEYNEVWLTDHSRAYSGDSTYIDINSLALVPAEDGYAYVMWEEINPHTEFICVRIAKIDSMGNQIGDIASIWARLSRDEPFYADGYLTWYTTSFSNYVDESLRNSCPTFYHVDVSRLAEYHMTDFIPIDDFAAELSTDTVVIARAGQERPAVSTLLYADKNYNLVEGVDFTIDHGNNYGLGTYKMTIKGRKPFSGSKTMTYQVIRKDISKTHELRLTPTKVTFDPTVMYNMPPTYAVYCNGEVDKYIEGKFDSVGAVNMWEAGTITYQLVVDGAYECGTLSATFTIEPVAAKNVTASLSNKSLKYTGKPLTPNVTVTYKGITVEPVQTRGSKTYTNYTVEYWNNIRPGTATAVVKFHGNYSGTLEIPFTITGTAPPPLGKGDVDGDGAITSTDARLVLQYYAGKIPAHALDLSWADVDGDKQITSTDARLILQKYAGKIKDFPKK